MCGCREVGNPREKAKGTRREKMFARQQEAGEIQSRKTCIPSCQSRL